MKYTPVNNMAAAKIDCPVIVSSRTNQPKIKAITGLT